MQHVCVSRLAFEPILFYIQSKQQHLPRQALWPCLASDKETRGVTRSSQTDEHEIEYCPGRPAQRQIHHCLHSGRTLLARADCPLQRGGGEGRPPFNLTDPESIQAVLLICH